MNIDHSFTSKVKHRACSKSIAHHELFHNFGSMYKVCLYYDEGPSLKVHLRFVQVHQRFLVHQMFLVHLWFLNFHLRFVEVQM